MRGALVFCLALIVLTACSEKPQVAGTGDDDKAWSGAADPYVANGWKAGDQASWNQQIRSRSQGQNEYVRIGAAP